MATPNDVARAFADLAHGTARQVNDEPTNIEPGFDPISGISWLPNGRARNRTGAGGMGAHIYYLAGTQSIANSTATTVSFDTKEYDGGNFWSISDPTYFVIPTNGVYHFTAWVQFASNSTGSRLIELRTFNDDWPIGRHIQNAVSGSPTSLMVNTEWYLYAGDKVRVRVSQNSGGALNIGASDESGTTPGIFGGECDFIIRCVSG